MVQKVEKAQWGVTHRSIDLKDQNSEPRVIQANETIDKWKQRRKVNRTASKDLRRHPLAHLCNNCKREVICHSYDFFEHDDNLKPIPNIVLEGNKSIPWKDGRNDNKAVPTQKSNFWEKDNQYDDLTRSEKDDLKAQCKKLQSENEILNRQLQNAITNIEGLEEHIQELMEAHAELLEDNERLRRKHKDFINNNLRYIDIEDDGRSYNSAPINKSKVPIPDTRFIYPTEELEQHKLEGYHFRNSELDVQNSNFEMPNDIDKQFKDTSISFRDAVHDTNENSKERHRQINMQFSERSNLRPDIQMQKFKGVDSIGKS